MAQIILIRPGSTDYDVQGRIQGRLDIPLSDEGRREVAEAIACLREREITALYTGVCRAARETADLIAAALQLKPRPLDRLHNLDHGLWQGMLIEEVKHKQPRVYKQWQENPEIVCPPEGEMLSTVVERTESVLSKLVRKHRFGAIGLVVPEPLASVIRCQLKGGDFGDLWKAANGCRRIEVLEVPSMPPRSPMRRPAAAPVPPVEAAVVAKKQ